MRHTHLTQVHPDFQFTLMQKQIQVHNAEQCDKSFFLLLNICCLILVITTFIICYYFHILVARLESGTAMIESDKEDEYDFDVALN